jgi:excisionase family DNA binding protein
MLAVKAVAARLGLSKSLIYSLIDAGIIRATRHGRPGKRGTIRIDESEVERYLASCQNHEPTVSPPRPSAQGGLFSELDPNRLARAWKRES